MSIDEQQIAPPKLLGAPAYARPPAPVAAGPRPFDPDQLPLELYRSEFETGAYPPMARVHTPAVDIAGGPRNPEGQLAGKSLSRGLRPRSFNLKAVAGPLVGDE